MSNEGGGRRAAVALSGGVDSAASAVMLKDRGFEVLALTLRVPERPGDRNQAVEAARAVARALGVEHEVLDVAEEFERIVISPFLTAYLQGETPNPCVVCNGEMKFGLLLEAALARGCDCLATGHYAGLEGGEEGPVRLLRGADPQKDQSYVLWTLDRASCSGRCSRSVT
jgi:tRNA-specific 2-thiouridylase